MYNYPSAIYEDLLCNMCGNSMYLPGTLQKHGLCNLKISGVYHSYHLLDNNAYIFSLCEECLRKMFLQFKIKPTIHGENIDGMYEMPISWEEDNNTYQYRVWCDTGGHHQAYINGLCNAIKDCPNKALYTMLDSENQFTEECFCQEHYTTHNDPYCNLVNFIPNILKSFL